MSNKICAVCGDMIPGSHNQPDGNIYVCEKIECHRAIEEKDNVTVDCKICGVLLTTQNIKDGDETCQSRECMMKYDPASFSSQGLRYNADKTRWSLVPSEVMSAIADHYTRGAKKYEDDDWRKGLSYNDTYDCAMRHIHAWKMDEEYDEETGSRHLIAAIWNLIALVYFQMHRGIYAKFDDRVPNAENTIFLGEPTPFSPEHAEVIKGHLPMSVAYQYQSTRVDTDLTGRGPNRRAMTRRKGGDIFLGNERRNADRRRNK